MGRVSIHIKKKKKGAIFPLLEDLNIPNMFGCGSEDGIRSLKKLHIYGCDNEVTKLPKELQLCTSIEDLNIVGCALI